MRTDPSCGECEPCFINGRVGARGHFAQRHTHHRQTNTHTTNKPPSLRNSETRIMMTDSNRACEGARTSEARQASLPSMVTDRLFALPQRETTSDDHYTPPHIFDSLGLTFDLDVASPPGGISWIPTRKYYTQEDDGLSQPWYGRVWMNPPFSNVTPWLERFIAHGNGVGLVPIVKSYWVTKAWQAVDGVTFLTDPNDMKFARPDGRSKPIMFPVMVISMGTENVEAARRIGPTR